MPRSEICDELLTLIGAGHETTASALGWAFERLRRHPDVLAELVGEVDEGGGEFRRATISECCGCGRSSMWPAAGSRRQLRPRRVADSADRTVLVRIADLHEDPEIFAHPERFDPHRFREPSRRHPRGWRSAAEHDGASALVSRSPKWTSCCERCWRISTIQTDAAADEKSYFRGIAHTPKRGGRVTVSRRK